MILHQSYHHINTEILELIIFLGWLRKNHDGGGAQEVPEVLKGAGFIDCLP